MENNKTPEDVVKLIPETLDDWVTLVPNSPADDSLTWEATSTNWPSDIDNMHNKYGVHCALKKLDRKDLREFLNFRLDFLEEELTETKNAVGKLHCDDVDCEEVVDGLIDLCVVAIGTLNAFGVDEHKAWEAVHNANMSKEVGIKEGRPNPLGLPDLIKPKGWVAPDHSDNHGFLPKLNE